MITHQDREGTDIARPSSSGASRRPTEASWAPHSGFFGLNGLLLTGRAELLSCMLSRFSYTEK
jgi:hypothetical protein